MSAYYMGVDLGGTKSHALIADETGRALSLGKAGPGNHESVGYEQMTQVLQDITGQALAGAGIDRQDICAVGYGIAGYDWTSELKSMMGAIDQLELNCPMKVVNDALIGLAAGAEAGWGVALVSGTGCNCWGWDDQRHTGRVTGYGSSMGEGAGASELVENAVKAVSLHWSRRGKPTGITQAIIDLCGARDQDDLVEGLCTFRYFVDASFAPHIFQLAETGDEVAGDLIRCAGEQLGSLAVGVIHQLSIESLAFDVVLVGSMFDGGERLVNPIRQQVQEVAFKARLVRLDVPPVIGGVLLGMDQLGQRPAGARERLIETTRALLQK
jgi:N-acetylglucosamine kinase-like BadF-type ATPase